MKKLLSCLLVLSMLGAALCLTLTAGADAPTYELIDADAQWTDVPNGGCTVTIEKKSGAVVFSGSAPGTWPATQCAYTEPISVPVENYSLKYEFEVENGNTNITFFFGSNHFPLSNTALGDVNFEGGSGDLMPDTYKGTIKLSDLVKATTNLNGTAFPEGAVVDGNLEFTGIVVYSVAGATITVKKLELVPNKGYTGDDSGAEPVDGSEDGEVLVDPSEDEPESEPEVVSEAESVPEVIAQPSEEQASDTPDESQPAAESKPADESAVSEPASEEPVKILGMELWAFILVLIAAAAVIAVILYIILGKKKKA